MKVFGSILFFTEFPLVVSVEPSQACSDPRAIPYGFPGYVGVGSDGMPRQFLTVPEMN